jgi:protein-S-isoprenylcysteine O-methyltransferase Ste14
LPTLVLWLSGNWNWVEGWTFGVWFSAVMTATLLWLYYKDPALLAERLRRPGTASEARSDLAILMGVKVARIAWIILPPLDVRFGWTLRLRIWSEVCGTVLYFVGSFFLFRAFTDNPYLSQLVRIEAERGQHVIDTGVYGVVRHPMYLGASLFFVGGALLLGSVWVFWWLLRRCCCSHCASSARKSSWHTILRVTRLIARGCATACCHGFGGALCTR